jgi:hypothetical protein
MSNQLKVLGVSALATGVVIGVNHISKGKIPFYVLGGFWVAVFVGSIIYYERQTGSVNADDNSSEQ